MSVPTLSYEEALEAMKKNRADVPTSMNAFYSSALGGIVTDPAAMQVPFDDKGIHQGHSIFDTCNIANGKVYALEFHLERFGRSIALAQIRAAPTIDEIRSIILQTCAAAVKAAGDDRSGAVRFWMSMGQGNISAAEQVEGSKPALFYVQVGGLGQTQLEQRGHQGSDFSGMSQADMKAASVPTTLVPMKPGILAKCKSTNYMLNSVRPPALTVNASRP